MVCLIRFPNLCVGQMTRESIQMAVSHGISAEQILHYLRSNAHPGMLKNVCNRYKKAGVVLLIYTHYSVTYPAANFGRPSQVVGNGERPISLSRGCVV